MNIIVILRQVPTPTENLVIDKAGKALDTEFTLFSLNEFDNHALEEAILLKEEGIAKKVTALSIDDEEVDRVLFTTLAKGVDRAVKITGKIPENNHQLAWAVHNIIKSWDYDLILTGVQSANDWDGQLAPVLAAILKIPCINVVNGIEITAGTTVVRKEYPHGVLAEFEVAGPAVLGIQAARKIPRYAPLSMVRYVQQKGKIEESDGGEFQDYFKPENFSMAIRKYKQRATMLDSTADLLNIIKSQSTR